MKSRVVRIGENVWDDYPDSEVDDHYMGDECWCDPKIHIGPAIMCHDNILRPQIVIEHFYKVKVAPIPGLGIIKKSNNKGDKNYG